MPQPDFETARSFVGRRVGTRLVTGYLIARIYGARKLCLTMKCDCGRRSVVRLSTIKQGKRSIKGCAACSSIKSVGGPKQHGRGITELEAQRMLNDMEASEQ